LQNRSDHLFRRCAHRLLRHLQQPDAFATLPSTPCRLISSSAACSTCCWRSAQTEVVISGVCGRSANVVPSAASRPEYHKRIWRSLRLDIQRQNIMGITYAAERISKRWKPLKSTCAVAIGLHTQKFFSSIRRQDAPHLVARPNAVERGDYRGARVSCVDFALATTPRLESPTSCRVGSTTSRPTLLQRVNMHRSTYSIAPPSVSFWREINADHQHIELLDDRGRQAFPFDLRPHRFTADHRQLLLRNPVIHATNLNAKHREQCSNSRQPTSPRLCCSEYALTGPDRGGLQWIAVGTLRLSHTHVSSSTGVIPDGRGVRPKTHSSIAR